VVSYELVVPPKVRKVIARLPDTAKERVSHAIDGLVETPRPVGSLKLKGSELRRVRVGEYRILYDVDDESRKITITKVDHRRESYR
jgi:mRNA interferase RelE/StbE